MSAPVAHLRALVGGAPGERTIEGPESVIVGRGSAAHWRLDEPLLSRRHLEIGWRDGALWATDLGSRNGSRVNGTPLDAPRRLGDGDRVAIGPVVIEVAIPASSDDRTVARPAAEETAATRAAPPVRAPRRSSRWPGAAAAVVALGGALVWPADRPPPPVARPDTAAEARPVAARVDARAAPRAPARPTLRRDAIRLYAVGRRDEARGLFERLRDAGEPDPAIDLVLRVMSRR
jgi:pSer/pThr/pTyr-binding forkhead associated (FHA) protein